MINYTYLLLGLVYVTFLPGFVFVEYFFPKLLIYKKLPLYFILSTLISTYFTYLASLIFGFNRTTVILNITLFVILLLLLLIKRKIKFKITPKHFLSLFVGLIIYAIFFISLQSGIFRFYNGSYIMSGPNWQDTAMHLSIIESLSEGNFPPQAPYFSGQDLSYYYFSDLHAAIPNVLFGDFFPWILVILNPFFATTFFFSVYALSYAVLKNSRFSVFSGLISLLFGNLGFVNLIKDTFLKSENYFSLLTNNAYHLDFESTLQMVPMADYFLQNRPMMVGLPSLVVIVFLLINYFKTKKFKYLLLAGLINALLIKFQFFGLLIGIISFCVFSLYRLVTKSVKFRLLIKEWVLFIIPSAILILIFGFGKAGERSVFQVVLESFSFGAWEDHNFIWFLKFIISNFNIPILIFLLSVFFSKKINNKYFNLIYLLAIVIFVIPFSIKFTIYDYDMFKFFYYSIPFISLSFVAFSYYLYRRNRNYLIVLIFVLILTSWTSLNMLTHAFLNKTHAYSVPEYMAGLWVRENTNQNVVFVTYPSVHSPISDIAGRLRVLSYINWPYSHGFNTGSDNVFSRLSDIEKLFKNAEDINIVSEILDKYKIDYIYLGDEEIANFENSQNKLESNNSLEKIYDRKGIKIFKKRI